MIDKGFNPPIIRRDIIGLLIERDYKMHGRAQNNDFVSIVYSWIK